MARKSKQRSKQDGCAMQYDTIKVRLSPAPEQAALFEKTFGCCRYIWNQMLADQQKFYLETGKHFIPTPAKYKKDAPFLTEVDNQALIQEHIKLSQAFKVFFKDSKKFHAPKFKSKKHDRNSFTACNHVMGNCQTVYITKDAVRMTKVGLVKAKFPRRPRNGWRLKRITVEKTKTGKYYGYILYEHEVEEPKPVVPTEDTTVGLKYSMSHFYVTDSGEMADAPHWLQQSLEKLKRIQKRLRRMERGSKNYNAMVQKYRELHEHIANQRRDWLHKESTRIANEWDAVCIRADDMRAISSAAGMSSALDSGFGMFREMLRYKLARRGKQLILVDRFAPTTRICHQCGHVEEKPIDHRKQLWVCPNCGAILNREVNAAQNIKAQGLAQYYDSQELRKSA